MGQVAKVKGIPGRGETEQLLRWGHARDAGCGAEPWARVLGAAVGKAGQDGGDQEAGSLAWTGRAERLCFVHAATATRELGGFRAGAESSGCLS